MGTLFIADSLKLRSFCNYDKHAYWIQVINATVFIT